MIERILRWSAVAIAVAAIVDPSISLSGRVPPRVAIVSAGGAASNDVRNRLKDELRDGFEVIEGAVSNADAMLVVGDRYPVGEMAPNLPVSTVTLTPTAPRAVRIAAMQAPGRVPLRTAVPLTIDVEASGAEGAASVLTISSGGVEVGRLSHTWRADVERWRAALDVVPVGDPPFVVRASVNALAGESRGADRSAAVLVDALPRPLRVMFFEPRPSWAGTFVRRALESDARFAVNSVTEISRGVDIRAGDAVSLRGTVDADAADVVVAGGLDRLSAEDVHSLDRFMRERGGAVVLLPDGPVDAGPVRRLVPMPAPAEISVDAHAPLTMAARLPRIDASEMLIFREMPVQAQVLARANGSNTPVIIVVPRGDGRMMLSGALDAWRSRAESGVEFDRFWQAAIAGLALETPPLVDVTITPSLPAAGDRCARFGARAWRGGRRIGRPRQW